MLGDHRIAIELEVGHVRGQAHAGLGRHPRPEVPPLRRRRENPSPIPSAPESIGDGGGEYFRAVATQLSVLSHYHHVGPMPSERFCLLSKTGSANQNRMHFTTA
jgi:hypothetical protein